MYRDSNRDRDDNGVPDWQEDENYLDEAPPGAPVGAGGCLLSLLSLATAATVLGRLARAPAAYRSRVSRTDRVAPQ
jgi:hypothetical protein